MFFTERGEKNLQERQQPAFLRSPCFFSSSDKKSVQKAKQLTPINMIAALNTNLELNYKTVRCLCDKRRIFKQFCIWSE